MFKSTSCPVLQRKLKKMLRYKCNFLIIINNHKNEKNLLFDREYVGGIIDRIVFKVRLQKSLYICIQIRKYGKMYQ